MIGRNKIYTSLTGILDRVRESEQEKKKKQIQQKPQKGGMSLAVELGPAEAEILRELAKRYQKTPEEVAAQLVAYQLKKDH